MPPYPQQLLLLFVVISCELCVLRFALNLQVLPYPRQLLVTDDAIRIALPSGPGGADNCVLGLGMDYCADTVSCSCYCVLGLGVDYCADTVSCSCYCVLGLGVGYYTDMVVRTICNLTESQDFLPELLEASYGCSG